MIVQDLSKIRSSRCASRAASQVSAIARVLLLEFSDPVIRSPLGCYSGETLTVHAVERLLVDGSNQSKHMVHINQNPLDLT